MNFNISYNTYSTPGHSGRVTLFMAGKSGNTNALKHGLYARRYKPDEIKDLRKMPFDDLRQEIALLRVTLNRLAGLLEQSPDDETKIKYTNAATNAALAIGTLIRAHSILAGTYTPLDDALESALTTLDPYYQQDDLK